jgi:hypothetical protein
MFAILMLAGMPPVRAQGGAPLRIAVPAVRSGQERGMPVITTGAVLEDRNLRELLQNGFPARLHYRLELWSSGGLFDNLKQQVEWDLIVRYNPLERRYTAARVEADRVTTLGTFATLVETEQAVSRPFQPAVKPIAGHDRSYYIVTLNVAMLSVNDLDEVERWLRGELQPAVRGQKNPGTALSRGAMTLMTRLLGGERRHYEARSAKFTP